MAAPLQSWEQFRTLDNVRASDRFLARLHPLTVLIGGTALRNLARYRKAYRNYVSVTLARVGLRSFPIEGRLRDGTTVRLARHQDAQLYSSSRIECHPAEDAVRVQFADRWLTIKGGWSTGDVHGVYVEGIYDRMPVEGRVVIDVGGSIGDSPLYFAARRARQVIALEPWPSLFSLLQENVHANGFDSVVVPLNAAIGASPGTLTLDDGAFESQRGQVRQFASGRQVPKVTLEELVNRYSVDGGLLKLDCEGGEYDAILGSDRTVLRRFAVIQMEYHYGYLNLRRKLEEAGFAVRYDRPFKMLSPAVSRPELWMGFLTATRTG